MPNRTWNVMAAAGVFAAVLSSAALAGERYDGQSLYQLNCSNCHGVYGEGDGAVTPALDVVLKDLRYLSERNDGEFPAHFVSRIIDGRETRAAHGPPGMPVWGAEFARGEGVDSDAEARVHAKVDAIVAFLESIQIQP